MSQRCKVLPEESDGLTKLVGYEAIEKALGISRSTIERAVKSGELPAPAKIKSRSVWLASDINAWAGELFAGRLKNLSESAVADAEDLEPDDLDAKALGLILQSMEKRTGTKSSAENLAIHVTRRITEEELHAAEKAEFALYAERFAGLDKRRTCVLAAWLFESIRADIGSSAPGREKLIYSDPRTLEKFGQAALHDADWETIISEFDAAEGCT